MSEAEGNPGIWIKSTRRAAGEEDAERACLLTWGELQWYAPVGDVMQTAKDLAACAAYADMIGVLLRVGLDGGTLGRMLPDVMRSALGDRAPVHGGMLGADSTIGVMAAGSSQNRQGLVMLKRGALGGGVSPQGARDMAAHWIEVASAVMHDEVTEAALADVLGVSDPDRLEGLFRYMSELRLLEGAKAEDFRRSEGARLRELMNQPPSQERGEDG